ITGLENNPAFPTPMVPVTELKDKLLNRIKHKTGPAPSLFVFRCRRRGDETRFSSGKPARKNQLQCEVSRSPELPILRLPNSLGA
ncbi:MAG: hypothetical protein ACTHLW_07440, partial [Verrucomicrobiota bacterium]